MAVVPIITVPNPLLTKRSQKVKKVDGETVNQIKNLLDTLDQAKDPEGAGIAASQIGINKQICVVRNFYPNIEDPEGEPIIETFVLINPKIISKSKETELDWEGCLSVPDVYGKVPRYKNIKVNALNQNGERITLKAKNYFARVIQHEIDHLNGFLFTEKAVGDTINTDEMESLSTTGVTT